ncbi:Nose resistant to fluoxetine protein 6 [Nymphon striatum]|nr:Nose resistant to fluoxetine protein 6 [Nymphon striatum]
MERALIPYPLIYILFFTLLLTDGRTVGLWQIYFLLHFRLFSNFVFASAATVCSIHKKFMYEEEELIWENSQRLSIYSDLYWKVSNHITFEERVNSTCKDAIFSFIEGYNKGDDWALNMMDANGNVRSGVLEGSLTWPGLYSQCLKVRKSKTENQKDIQGQYCLMQMDTPNFIKFGKFGLKEAFKLTELNEKLQHSLGLRMGLCVPSLCSAATIKYAVETLREDGITADVTCTVQSSSSEESSLDWGIMTYVVLMIVVFTCIATYCDMVLKTEGKCESEMKEKNLIEFLCLFSLRKSWNSFKDVTSPPGTIGCLNGIRVISTIHIVAVHVAFFTPLYLFNSPLKKVIATDTNPLYSPIIAGHYAVDTFFFMSGFLVTHPFLYKMTKPGANFNVLKFYGLRWWRLTPVLMLILWTTYIYFPQMIDGPFSGDALPRFGDCYSNWWTNMLYINNLVHVDKMCLSHSWYLASDMQMFLFAPIILFALLRYPKIGILINTACIVVSLVIRMTITIVNDYPPYGHFGFDKVNEFFGDIYIQTYCRMIPYCFGIFLAYYLKTYGYDIVLTNWQKFFGWAIDAVVITCLLSGFPIYFTLYPNSKWAVYFYAGFSKILWSGAMLWIIFVCVTANAKLLNSFLSCKLFTMLSKITYCLYLIHPCVIYQYLGNLQDTIVFSHVNTIILFTSILIYSSILAFIATLFIEIPLGKLPRFFNLNYVTYSSPATDPDQPRHPEQSDSENVKTSAQDTDETDIDTQDTDETDIGTQDTDETDIGTSDDNGSPTRDRKEVPNTADSSSSEDN